jgi:methylmalonyl-CoA mutase N-terminal domain/subunit
VEALTDQLEARIRVRVDEIEARGDPEALSADGFFREIFHEAMEAAQLGVETGAFPLVGVNVHELAPEDDTLLKEIATAKINSWRDHTKAIERFKRERDVAALHEGLEEIAAAAKGSDNIIPAVISALDASATIGEITTTMRSGLGLPSDIFDHPLPSANGVGDRHVA